MTSIRKESLLIGEKEDFRVDGHPPQGRHSNGNTRNSLFRPVLSNPWVTVSAILLMVLGLGLLGASLASRLSAPTVKAGNVVEIHYSLLLENRTVYHSTKDGEPVQYVLGEGQVLPGLEEAIVGMRVGEQKTISMTAAQAYGPRRPELIITLRRDELPEGSQPAVGQEILTESESGSPIVLIVTEVTESSVTLDANHPLSGHNLTFKVEVVGIDDPTVTDKRTY